MNFAGYAHIKKDAKTGVSAIPMDEFLDKICRVMEFGFDGSVMVVNAKGTGIGLFDKEDIFRKFECTFYGEYICPPNMEFIEQMAYVSKLHLRKGGYAPILRSMVIQASLATGKFHDNFLWAKQ